MSFNISRDHSTIGIFSFSHIAFIVFDVIPPNFNIYIWITSTVFSLLLKKTLSKKCHDIDNSMKVKLLSLQMFEGKLFF